MTDKINTQDIPLVAAILTLVSVPILEKADELEITGKDLPNQEAIKTLRAAADAINGLSKIGLTLWDEKNK